MNDRQKPIVDHAGEYEVANDGLPEELGRRALIDPDDLDSRAEEPEILLESDEAYEIIRRFCFNRLNQLFEIADLRAHLENNGVDVTGVNDNKLLKFFDSLAVYIATDLQQIHGLRITRVEDGPRTAFFEITAPARPVVQKLPEVIWDNTPEKSPEDELLERFATTVSRVLRDDAPRRDISAQIAEQLKMSDELVSENITKIIERGLVFGYRKDSASWLTLDSAHATEMKKQANAARHARATERERVDDEPINLALAESILKVFIAPGRHSTDAFTIRELWREIHSGADVDDGSFTDDDAAGIRVTARKLAKAGLAWCGQGSQEHVNKTVRNPTFRIGVVSSDMKKYLQDLDSQDGLSRVLDELKNDPNRRPGVIISEEQ